MKSIVIILCILLLLLTACAAPTPDKSEKEINLAVPQKTGWEAAKEMILAGKVKMITQSHNLTVILDLKDGSQFTTTEPTIDEVFRVVEQCDTKCADISLMTE